METKRCSKCKQIKPLDHFSKDKAIRGGYTWWCKPCMQSAIKEWEEKHKQERKEYFRQWHINNLERRKAARSKREKERWKNDQAFRDKKNHLKIERRKIRIESEPGYIEKTREWGRAHNANRRSHIYHVTNDFTENQWKELIEKFDHRCAYCGRKNAKLERDHKIPLSRGGAHTASNIVPACRWCNAHKATMTDKEFFEYLRRHPRK